MISGRPASLAIAVPGLVARIIVLQRWGKKRLFDQSLRVLQERACGEMRICVHTSVRHHVLKCLRTYLCSYGVSEGLLKGHKSDSCRVELTSEIDVSVEGGLRWLGQFSSNLSWHVCMYIYIYTARESYLNYTVLC